MAVEITPSPAERAAIVSEWGLFFDKTAASLTANGLHRARLEVVAERPTQAYFDMIDRNRLNRQTTKEIRSYLGLTANTPVAFDVFPRVTLLDNEPYYPGYALVTEAKFGSEDQRLQIVTNDIERPFSDEVTTHLGLRSAANGWVRRRVVDVDHMSLSELTSLRQNPAQVVDLVPRVSHNAGNRQMGADLPLGRTA